MKPSWILWATLAVLVIVNWFMLLRNIRQHRRNEKMAELLATQRAYIDSVLDGLEYIAAHMPDDPRLN